MPKITHRKKRLSSFKLIVLGFAGVIVLGALILMLPFSSTAGVVTPFHEALFTSTSAVCVTGLVVQDTGSYWSAFGQTVILLMIQPLFLLDHWRQPRVNHTVVLTTQRLPTTRHLQISVSVIL